MRRKRRTGGRYRGARRRVDLLIPILVALIISAAVVLYAVNENMVFTKDGAFFSPSEKTEKTPVDVETNLVIEEEEVTEPPVESASPNVLAEEIRAYFIPIGTVKNAELFDLAISDAATKPDINTLVLEVKAEDGTLAFATSSPLGKIAGADVNGADETLSAAVSKARASGYKVAFYMSAFKDNETARKNQPYSARTKNKVIFIDGTNVRWLSAYSPEARGYVTDVIKKAKSFSPDEIILSNVSFPAVGKTEILFYEKELGEKRDALKSFMTEAKVACEGTKLSAVYENYNDSCLSASGQNVEDFKNGFDSLYVNKNGSYYTKTGADSGIANAVIIDTVANGESFMIKK